MRFGMQPQCESNSNVIGWILFQQLAARVSSHLNSAECKALQSSDSLTEVTFATLTQLLTPGADFGNAFEEGKTYEK